MRKLKLHVDDLRVESFAAGGRVPSLGTVRGNMPIIIPASDDVACGGSGETGSQTCNGDDTCRKTCAQTCGLNYCSDLTQCASWPHCC